MNPSNGFLLFFESSSSCFPRETYALRPPVPASALSKSAACACRRSLDVMPFHRTNQLRLGVKRLPGQEAQKDDREVNYSTARLREERFLLVIRLASWRPCREEMRLASLDEHGRGRGLLRGEAVPESCEGRRVHIRWRHFIVAKAQCECGTRVLSLPQEKPNAVR